MKPETIEEFLNQRPHLRAKFEEVKKRAVKNLSMEVDWLASESRGADKGDKSGLRGFIKLAYYEALESFTTEETKG